MKKLLMAISMSASVFALPSQALGQQGLKEAKVMEQALLTGEASGICATYEKMFKYARSSGKKEDMDFARSFFNYSANDLGKTPQGFLDFCKDSFAASSRMYGIIDKYK